MGSAWACTALRSPRNGLRCQSLLRIPPPTYRPFPAVLNALVISAPAWLSGPHGLRNCGERTLPVFRLTPAADGAHARCAVWCVLSGARCETVCPDSTHFCCDSWSRELKRCARGDREEGLARIRARGAWRRGESRPPAAAVLPPPQRSDDRCVREAPRRPSVLRCWFPWSLCTPVRAGPRAAFLPDPPSARGHRAACAVGPAPQGGSSVPPLPWTGLTLASAMRQLDRSPPPTRARTPLHERTHGRRVSLRTAL